MPSRLTERQELPSPKHSILRRAMEYSVILTAWTIVTLTGLSFIVALSLLEQQVFRQMEISIAAKEQVFEQTLSADRERTSLLAQGSVVRDAITKTDGRTELETLYRKLIDDGVAVQGLTLFRDDGESEFLSVGVPVPAPRRAIDSTVIEPVMTRKGWMATIIYAPIRHGEGDSLGVLGVRYDALRIMENLFSLGSFAEKGEVLVARKNEQGQLLLFNRKFGAASTPLSLGSFEQNAKSGAPAARAVLGEEGRSKGSDYTGRNRFVVFRSLPTFGWGLLLEVDRDAALEGALRLGRFSGALGAALLIFAGLLGFVLFRSLVASLLELFSKVQGLHPPRWSFEKSIASGDEVELLDAAVCDMAGRLRLTYERMEKQLKEQQEQLRELYAKDRSILDTIAHGIVVVDPEGTIIDLNPAASAFLQLPLDQILKAPFTEVFKISHHHEVLSDAENPLLRCLQGKSETHQSEFHLSLIRRDETLLPISISVSPLLLLGESIGAIAIFQDMTRERRLDYLKSEFISLASHQLRTPLSSIEWYIELLQDAHDGLSEEQRAYVVEMVSASRRMALLIDALLRVSKLEGGGIKPHWKNTDLRELVGEAAEDLRMFAKERRVSCDIELPSSALFAHTDPMLLRIVLQNILSNAVKYSPSGGEVLIRLSEEEGKILLMLKDSGMGIPEEDRLHIFTKLFRGSNARKTETDGSGLGLYISRMIMDQLCGKIWFENNEGKGTTFWVEIPKGECKILEK